MEIFYQAVGWIGMAIIVMTYYYVTTGVWGVHTRKDELFNIIGSTLVGINVYHAHAWPAFTLQVVWVAIALISIAKFQKNKQ